MPSLQWNGLSSVQLIEIILNYPGRSEMSYIDDYEFGKKEEELCLPILKRYCKGIKLNKDKFNRWDAENTKTVLEIKSRKMFSNEYKETMISSKKIAKGLQETRQVGFIFNFFDGIYFIELSEKFKTYPQKLMKVKDRNGINENWEYKTFIPIKDLTLLHAKDMFI